MAEWRAATIGADVFKVRVCLCRRAPCEIAYVCEHAPMCVCVCACVAQVSGYMSCNCRYVFSVRMGSHPVSCNQTINQLVNIITSRRQNELERDRDRKREWGRNPPKKKKIPHSIFLSLSRLHREAAFYEWESVHTILLTTTSTIMIESDSLYVGAYNKVHQCG